ncbi:MAG TPA: hypothetical protein VIC34_10725 [Croceibacterium sp.]
MAKIMDFAKESKATKLLFYVEIDDRVKRGPEIGSGILAQFADSRKLVMFKGNPAEILRLLVSEAEASGKDGWRQIAVVVDHGAITVARKASPGPITGFNERMHATAELVFPGHT